MKFYIYDLETLNNCFLFTGKFLGESNIQVFELSFRKNMRTELSQFLSTIKQMGAIMVGYNNLGFDYPLIHQLMHNPSTFDYVTAYTLCKQIFAQPYGRNNMQIWFNDRLIPQLDLMKLNHFDNKARRTSLKSLQFAMRSPSVEDLPFIDRNLTEAEIEQLIAYNIHDVTETEKFLQLCMPAVEMRQEFIKDRVLFGDVLNFSDVKIGEQYLINKIGKDKCYDGKNPRQTYRSVIHFKDVILPKIHFRTEEFQAVLDWFNSQSIKINADKKTDKIEYNTTLAGMHCKFALGGVHGSVLKKVYHSSETHVIKDVDVSGMYVAVAIANMFAPEHLGKDFTLHYKQLQTDRARYKKGTGMNALLKLAGNGVYGKSSDIYSPFYDPKYTFTVTVNGQLQLAQLLEVISLIPGVEIIQANTDGITLLLPRKLEDLFQYWKSWWENHTGLKLEEVEYKSMFIRDCNNYIAVYTDGKVKRKGAYWYPETIKDYDGQWHKNFSKMIVPKICSEVLTGSHRIEDMLALSTDKFDFMLRHKTPAGSKTMVGDREVSKTCRYYVSTKGEPMSLFYPCDPKLKGTFKRKNSLTDQFYNQVLREIGPGVHDLRIHTKNKTVVDDVWKDKHSGFKVKVCNDHRDFDWSDVDYEFYKEEVLKLMKGELEEEYEQEN